MCNVLEKRLSGAYGAFWQKEAKKQVADMQTKADNGEIIFEINGAVKWVSSGNYLPEECVELLLHTAYADKVDPDITALARKVQTHEQLERYRESRKNYVPSDEELYEMRAAFGEGTTVVDVITGQRFTV